MRRDLLFPLLPAAAALAAYANALPASFQWDDFNVIVDYGPVHSLSGWLADAVGGIRPLLKLSYALNWSVSEAPLGFHLVNNIVHALNAMLVYLLMLGFAGKNRSVDQARWFALGTALLFALHPVRTEAVTYVSGRSLSLMTVFYLASLLAWTEGRKRGSARLSLWLSPALFVLALLTRETAVTLPLALLLWGVCVEGRTLTDSLRGARVHFALLAVAFGTAILLGRPVLLFLQSLNDFEGTSLLLRQSHGIFYLLTRWFTPTGQNIDPDLPENVSLTAASAGEALVLLTVLAVGIYGIRRRHPAGFCALWILLHLLPTNSLLPRYDVANERHLYLAALGLELAFLSTLFHLAANRPRILLALMTVLVASMAAATAARNRDYRSEITLWEDTVEKSPLKPRPHVNLGHAYLLAGRDDEARAHFLRALELDPANETARKNLGVLDWGKTPAGKP